MGHHTCIVSSISPIKTLSAPLFYNLQIYEIQEMEIEDEILDILCNHERYSDDGDSSILSDPEVVVERSVNPGLCL
ncbi:hypothetical protein KM1_177490 [Entamoeba histolytica HM-3:IMSS]|uniref:Uncharacterized protein n=2 Tax=Entamoeba histolytica TaxID=5759 RepID=A0A175JUS5_ENTHI|nr:hypothetical protein KM1_177490 [Entamoeba histolytica HM-3:IMSS]GAT97188.1 hypothetical protein CL6EHI_c00130 [Entamoeba histolytica]